MKHHVTTTHRGGFTMVELVVVIAIIGILLAVVLVPLAVRLQVHQIQDQERKLAEIKDALIGFAQSQGRLPCADTDTIGDGLENAPCAASSIGELPYATLGTGATDRWGRRYRYAVSPAMTLPALTGQAPGASGLNLSTLGVLTVNAKQYDKPTDQITTTTLTINAASVIVSLGANGFGGTDTSGVTLRAPDGADELENTNGDAVFISRVRTAGSASCDDSVATAAFCEFDDVITVISTPFLLGKMVQAGKLP